MRIVYCSKTAYYAAYAMAAIHIGVYKEEELPCFNDILKQWELCCLYGHQKGNLIYMGLDEGHREVFIIGAGNHGSMVEKAYRGIDTIYKLTEDNYFAHVNRWEGKIPILLNYIMKYLSIKNIGAKVFVYWFRRNYNKWVLAVKEIK